MRQVSKPRSGVRFEGTQEILQVEGLRVCEVHAYSRETKGYGRSGGAQKTASTRRKRGS